MARFSTVRFEHLDRNGRVFMHAVYTGPVNYAWTETLKTQSSVKSFEDVTSFIPDEVKAAFDDSEGPSGTDALRDLK
ncbi:hypothetical protein LTR62_007252 [Meristemomyces frigidus]|uniref:Uncharacterized protein n=1 Tax=Meristemomyces frigidus TaxID=1508187 RepID=A0AAN7YHX5_9PEZI|nr:hypothetical protein LTR62_007252 [Meristemomyces frigidus]